ncbi:hypothetical protein BJQ94_13845 [Cryobacterium sp. SO2]|uniref:hypothetical protein n=1 Tax=Cryobacterium sp. SO2 TaxID=1897060 RepID=UPI00223E5A00|nr:hypothetical protein [Cryobacterium sp. SO2]WEO76441.1 hypothetical protein BJQ94_13845 [Cryobacterium sp. SO2]
MPQKTGVGDWGRWVVTAVIIAIFVWWLLIVNLELGTQPTKNDGTGLVTDPYAHAKETLAVVVPFLTLILGYWFGVRGVDEAKKTAAAATQDAQAANVKFAVLRATASKSSYEQAVSKYPSAFGR